MLILPLDKRIMGVVDLLCRKLCPGHWPGLFFFSTGFPAVRGILPAFFTSLLSVVRSPLLLR